MQFLNLPIQRLPILSQNTIENALVLDNDLRLNTCYNLFVMLNLDNGIIVM